MTTLAKGQLLTDEQSFEDLEEFGNAFDARMGAEAVREALAGVGEALSDAEVRRSPDAFELSDGDTGPVIPPEVSALILRRGWSSKAAAGGGRGIGLALVAQIAARHAGKVTVAASELGGALLTVTLRRQR